MRWLVRLVALIEQELEAVVYERKVQEKSVAR